MGISRHGEDPMAEALKQRGEAPGDEAFALRDQDSQWPHAFSSGLRDLSGPIHCRIFSHDRKLFPRCVSGDDSETHRDYCGKTVRLLRKTPETRGRNLATPGRLT